ncbi:MAG: ester cyclase [Acidimicrobiales bacterium]
MADLKAIAHRMFDEVISQGNFDVLDEIVHEDVIEHEELGDMPSGRAGVRAWFTMMRDAFPDLRAEIVAMAVDGDELWVQSVFHGTHRAEFMGIPATGKSFSMNVIDRLRFVDGKAAEHWGVADQMGMMAQLGLSEPPG